MNLNDILRPSAAHRWLQCTGSVELILKLTPEYMASLTNPAAREGQRLHQVASDILEGKGTLDSVSDEDKVLIQPYVEYVQRAEDNLNKLEDSGYWVEKTILQSPYGIKGTPDFISLHKNSANVRYVTVVDLKTGRIPVAVADNAQLKLYALLFINYVPPLQIPYYVNFVIIQPKCEGITEHQITYASLKEWEQNTLIPAIKDIEDKKYTYQLGDHCKYCPAKPICPEFAKNFKKIQHRSKELISEDNLDYLFWVTEQEKDMTAYMKTVKDFLIHGLKTGSLKSIEYTLVPTYGHERWAQDEDTVVAWLIDEKIDAYERRIKSPAKVKKELQEDIPKDKTERKCVGYKIENVRVLANKVFTKVGKGKV